MRKFVIYRGLASITTDSVEFEVAVPDGCSQDECNGVIGAQVRVKLGGMHTGTLDVITKKKGEALYFPGDDDPLFPEGVL